MAFCEEEGDQISGDEVKATLRDLSTSSFPDDEQPQPSRLMITIREVLVVGGSFGCSSARIRALIRKKRMVFKIQGGPVPRVQRIGVVCKLDPKIEKVGRRTWRLKINAK